jgi:NitT/TauT family transport system substrate-binding protein
MRKPVLLLILVLGLSLSLAACMTPPAVEAPETVTQTGSEPTEEQAAETDGDINSELTTVTVGHLPITIYAPLFVADQKGYFAEEGINVELVPVQGGTENVVQVASGNFDVAGGGIGAGMFNAVARDIDFEIVAPLHTERPPLTTPLVVSKTRFDEGELTEVADLAGKVVSTNAKGAATEYWLWRALQQGDLSFEDVDVTGVGFRDVAPALENGSLDAGMLAEPLATFAEDQGLIARLSDDFLDSYTATVLYYNKEWAEANPDLASGFVKAFIRGARDLNGDQWYDERDSGHHRERHQCAGGRGRPRQPFLPRSQRRGACRGSDGPTGLLPHAGPTQLRREHRLSQFINASYAEQAVEALGGEVEWE